uniref:ADP-ribosylglycohydrolase n=1 Tax=Chromera velia CCMP2878 TaxID=1169474 RepID=A0A0G4FX76_9ALVE|eukprot:Cvel_3822.t1-p1 / transcript=Cvel_3822.t1 / gene=Cvel_3822 / organism=Chromera_velia_CCMP2878 / gene_product=Crystallin J1A, putative / transcript_product=Crystallin J1A, putative / location=Cvel_scaffold161:54384-58511(-) / protein_length=402 / sequence_SO=supercontig / SO=protein_coding / is_pseudo=false
MRTSCLLFLCLLFSAVERSLASPSRLPSLPQFPSLAAFQQTRDVMKAVSESARLRGAVIGSFVADAAGMPVHWVYPKFKPELAEQLNERFKDKKEFCPESFNPFYKLPLGQQSGYGDQTVALLRALVEAGGWDRGVYCSHLQKMFGDGTKYDPSQLSSSTYSHESKTAQNLPVTGGWRHQSVKHFLQKIKETESAEEGKGTGTGLSPDAQMDGVAKLAPLVALYAGSPRMLQVVEECVRVTQEDQEAVDSARVGAKLLESLLMGEPIEAETVTKAVKSAGVSASMEAALLKSVDSVEEDHSSFAVREDVGISCKVPNNLTNSLHCLLKCAKGGDPSEAWVSAVRATLNSLGCNCSRLCFVGGCMGAVGGEESVPADWIEKTASITEIRALSEELLGLRDKVK